MIHIVGLFVKIGRPSLEFTGVVCDCCKNGPGKMVFRIEPDLFRRLYSSCEAGTNTLLALDHEEKGKTLLIKGSRPVRATELLDAAP